MSKRDYDDYEYNEDDFSTDEYLEKSKRGFKSTTVDAPDDVPWFKIDSKDTRFVDIIPFIAGKGNPYADPGMPHHERTFWIHKGLGPDGKQSRVCLKKTFGERCPVCETADRWLNSGKIDKETHKAFKPKERQLFNVIDTKDRDKGFQLWDVAPFHFGNHLRDALDLEEQGSRKRKFASPLRGYTLKLLMEKRVWDGKTLFNVRSVGLVKRAKQYDKKIVKEAHRLDSFIIKPDYDEVKALFLQEDSDSSSTKKGKKMAKKNVTAESLGIEKGSEVEHEDLGTCIVKVISKDGKKLTLEDEDGDTHKNVAVTEVELVEEEEQPSKKSSKKKATKSSSKKKSKKDEEEEDEDEEDDEDEEEDDDEDEEEEDEDEDEEDEEEDDDEDEEEEDEDEDEEDEDEEPKKKRGKKPAAKGSKKGKK